MRRTIMWGLVLAATAVGLAAYAGKVLATPSFGFESTTIARGRLEEFAVKNMLVSSDADSPRPNKTVWHSTQKTKGDSDLYVQSNLWIPGGSSGWHTHPGHSLITITAGAVTVYDGHDPTCTPKVYTDGMTFVDDGGDHVHLIRNEGAVEARSITVQLLPAGAGRRIDAPANPACNF